jgi:hypothetical protein
MLCLIVHPIKEPTMMPHRILVKLVAAFAILSVFPTLVRADFVHTDSGTTGVFTLNSSGPGGVGQLVTLQLNQDGAAQLLTINGSAVGPYIALFPDTLTLTITSATTTNGTTLFGFSQSGDFNKYFNFGGGDIAHLSIQITTGLASDALPQDLVLGGTVTLVTNSSLYDFSLFNGGGTQSFSLDAAALSPPTTFRDIVLNGGTATGSGSFAETAPGPVPAPAGGILLSIGLVGTAGWRLLRQRRSSSASHPA